MVGGDGSRGSHDGRGHYGAGSLMMVDVEVKMVVE